MNSRPRLDGRLIGFAFGSAGALWVLALFINESIAFRLIGGLVFLVPWTVLIAYFLPEWKGNQRELKVATWVMIAEGVAIGLFGTLAWAWLR